MLENGSNFNWNFVIVTMQIKLCKANRRLSGIHLIKQVVHISI